MFWNWLEMMVAKHCECTNPTELHILRWLILCPINFTLIQREGSLFLKFLFLTTCCYVKWSVGKLSLSDPEAQSKLYRGADAGPGYGKMNGGSLDRLCDFVCVGEGGGGRHLS